jgi:RimJ/RimL family protein N-acetyltransferase
MKYFKKLVGENIYLSPMNVEDAEIYSKWMNDFNTTDYLGLSSNIVNLIDEKTWLEKSLKESRLQFAVVDLENDKLIGNCGFDDIDKTRRTATIGLFIGDEENRNKGYGTQMLKLLLDYGFNYLNFRNIMLKVYSFNERAMKAYKKVGFKEIGRRRESYFLNGKYYDDIYMDILSDEFSESYIKNKIIHF